MHNIGFARYPTDHALSKQRMVARGDMINLSIRSYTIGRFKTSLQSENGSLTFAC